jgi:hypothetical protein
MPYIGYSGVENACQLLQQKFFFLKCSVRICVLRNILTQNKVNRIYRLFFLVDTVHVLFEIGTEISQPT